MSRYRLRRTPGQVMERFCLGRGLAVTRWVRETGGGMNLRRPEFASLMGDVRDGGVSTLADGLLAVVDVFWFRLFGLRNYRTTLKQALAGDVTT
jgi:hypothetical protein